MLYPEITPRQDAPGGFGSRQIQLAGAPDLLALEFANAGHDRCRRPGPLGGTRQDEIRNQVPVHDPRRHLLRLDGTATREQAFEVLGTTIHSLCLAVPQESQPERTHNRPSEILVSYTRTGS